MAKKKIDPIAIEILPPKREKATFEITGITSYIPEKFDTGAFEDWQDAKLNKKVVGKKEKLSPEEAAEKLIYYVDGKEVIPGAAFHSAIGSAAHDVPGMYKTTAKRLITVEGEFIPFEYEHKNQRSDMVRLANPKRTPEIRHRYEFHGWKCLLQISYNSRLISVEQITNLMVNAGDGWGIGGKRPEKGAGNHGRFSVKCLGMEQEQWQN